MKKYMSNMDRPKYYRDNKLGMVLYTLYGKHIGLRAVVKNM